LGQKQTLESGLGMSALPLRTDMLSVGIDVCLVPIKDMREVPARPTFGVETGSTRYTPTFR
jgi:hypothetical protein